MGDQRSAYVESVRSGIARVVVPRRNIARRISELADHAIARVSEGPVP